MEKFPRPKHAETSRENVFIERLKNSNYTKEQIDEALKAASGEKEVGVARFLNHNATDEHVGQYKEILGGLELHTKEAFVNEQRTAQRLLSFSRRPEALETGREAA